MQNINVRVVYTTGCLMLMQDNKMLDCIFINQMYFDTLLQCEIEMLANLYKETYNATQCLTTAKDKTEQTINKLQAKTIMVH